MIQREDTSKTTPAISNDRPSTVIESDLRLRLRTFPRDAQTWCTLGSYLRSMGRLEEAEEALRKAISLNPGPTHFREELGLILMALGRLDEAYRYLDHRRAESTDSLSGEVDSLRAIERAVDEEVNVISPCVDCPDYSYYGCSKGGTCESVLQWRSKIRQLAVLKARR
jgi:tetratricopeptide (TPR) repeat protein